MTSPEAPSTGDTDAIAEAVAAAATRTGRTVAAAESLTGGAVSAALAKAPDSADWYAGAVVAYRSETKFRVLDVPEGPVVTAACAEQMARGVRRLLAADIGVALTGVGGPGDEEGEPPGTVFIALSTSSGETTHGYRFNGEPSEVVAQSLTESLRLLLDALSRPAPRSPR